MVFAVFSPWCRNSFEHFLRTGVYKTKLHFWEKSEKGYRMERVDIPRDSSFPDEDAGLMMKASGGDLDAYNLLFRKYRKPIYNFILQRVNDREIAEDLFQETFLRIFRAKENYKPDAKFSTFIYLIANNLCITHARKKNRWNFVKNFSDLIFKKDDEDSKNIEEQIECNDISPQEAVAGIEVGEKLKEAVGKLPDIHRTTFVLYEINNLSYIEIAEITGANIGTVKSRLNNARKKLRELLGEYFDDKPDS
jgi:RNA polymerase sigma-70 factor, ECF subfamily